MKGLGAYLVSLGLTSNARADELVTQPEILKSFGELYNNISQKKGKKFEFQESVDVNGDGKPDIVMLKSSDGFITIDNGIKDGIRFDMRVNTGDGWEKKLYGIVGDNIISPCKELYLEDPVKTLDMLRALNQHFGK